MGAGRSTNLNLSSWYANRELDISIEDSDTVAELEKIFLDDLQHATEVVLDDNPTRNCCGGAPAHGSGRTGAA